MSTENTIILEHDFEIDITFFKAVWDVKNPKNVKTHWSKFLAALQTPKIGEKESNGCFVGGYVDKHRRNENTKSRSMLTIDLDDIPSDFMDMFEHLREVYKNSFLLYSTHNHTKELPRYRLIIPFDKSIEMSTTLFRTVTQFVAKQLQLPKYDGASEVLSMAMQLPTIEADGRDEYVFKFQDGKPLDIETLIKSLPKIKVDYSNTHENRVKSYIDIAANGKFEGSRNNGLIKLLGHLLRNNIDPVLCYELLQYWWLAHRESHEDKTRDMKEFKNSYLSILENELKKGGY